jgi:hypothetical protein
MQVNLPWALLVEGDVVILKPGQVGRHFRRRFLYTKQERQRAFPQIWTHIINVREFK